MEKEKTKLKVADQAMEAMEEGEATTAKDRHPTKPRGYVTP